MKEETKRRFDVTISILTLIGAILGGGFAGYQYLESKRAERIGRALEYVKRGTDERIDKAWGKLGDHSRSLQESLLLVTSITDHQQRIVEIDRVIAEGFKKAHSNNDIRDAFNKLADLFEEIAVCAEAEYCDESTTRKFYGAKAFEFYAEWSRFFCWGQTYDLKNTSTSNRANPSYGKRFIAFWVQEPTLSDPCNLDTAKSAARLISLESDGIQKR